MRGESWTTSCDSCGLVFTQLRVRSGRRAILCDRLVCHKVRRWKRRHKGRDCPKGLLAKWHEDHGDARLEERESPQQYRYRSEDAERREAMLEQTAFVVEQKRIWIARVRKVAIDNPDLSWELLSERFDADIGAIRRACTGILRDRDMFATAWYSRRKTG